MTVGFVGGSGCLLLQKRGSAHVRLENGLAQRRTQQLRVAVRAAPVEMNLMERAKKDVDTVLGWLKPDKLATAAGALLMVATLIFAPMESLAASGGGRVGGSSFRSAPSRSYSPPSRSYGGGGYGGGGTYTAPSRAYGGFGYGLFSPFYYSAPIFGPTFYTPYANPFGGVVALMIGVSVAGAVIRTTAQSQILQFDSSSKTTLTVLKIGLLSSARSLQMDLDTLARSADTSTRRGLSMVLNDAALSLLRHPDYWAYGALSSKETYDPENEYGRLSLIEQSKIKEFTLSNVKNRSVESARASSRTTDTSKAPSEYISVTFVVASDGKLNLPRKISSAADLRSALESLGGVDESSIRAVDILWSPQSLRDTLSRQELLTDNPDLRGI